MSNAKWIWLDSGFPEPPEANKWRLIRIYCESLLQQSDKALLPDAPPYTQEQIDEVVAYREELRACNRVANPDDVIIPNPPEWFVNP